MIANVDLQQFAEVLHAYLASSISFVSGRPFRHNHAITSVAEIEQTLEEPGTTVFVYGNLDAAASPIQQIARDASSVADRSEDGPALTRARENQFENVASISLRDCKQPNELIPLVIDEFDRVRTGEERKRFQNLLQEISERRSPVRFVLCGVSNSLYDLMRAHESCYEERSVIPEFSEIARQPGAEPQDCANVQSASPHYVHIVPESLFCEMLNEPTFARNLR